MTYSGDKNDPYKRVHDPDDNFDGIPDYLQQDQGNGYGGNGRNGQSDYPIISSSTGGTSRQSDDSGEDELTAEELAGVQPDEDDLLAAEDRFDNGTQESTGQRSIAKSPLPRTALVGGVIGAVVLVGVILTMLVSGGGGGEVAEDGTPQENQEEDYTESDAYKSQLALVDQQTARERPDSRPQVSEAQPPEGEGEGEETPPEEPQTVTTSPPPRASRPTPPPSRPTPPPPPPAVAPAPAPPPQIEQPDPFAQWTTLASAGSQGDQFSLIQPVEEFEPQETATQNSAQAEPATTTRTGTQTGQQLPAEIDGFPVSVIGDNPIRTQSSRPRATRRVPAIPAATAPTQPLPGQQVKAQAPVTAQSRRLAQASSPGAQGILERRSVQEINAQQDQPETTALQVTLGTTAQAKLAVPIVASQDGETLGRFAVELTQPLLNPEGQVALPEGTLLITDVIGIDSNSLAIQQNVVALVYETASGDIVQETITPNTLIVRSSDGRALIASREGGGGRNTFTDILTIGGVSALGQIGSELNAADIFTSSTGTSSGDSSSSATTTVTDNSDTSIAGAALEGFFGSASEILQTEAEEARNQAEDVAPVLVVEEGQNLQVFVNGFLIVRR